ncbi:hypothetical protein L1D51_18900, partial [Pseudoalteromonas shioyasakiensis]|uniref:hypothetical protein n=1 Tax=Pseudoalteromonas shioyasakiensis TaxID=1190813 RepID=UPI001EFDBBBA
MRFLKLIAFIFLVLNFFNANAAESRLANISTIMLDKDIGDRLFIELETIEASSAPCHKNSRWDFIFTLDNNEVTKAMLSFIVKAQATNEKLIFIGTGTCNVFNELETLKRIE